MDADAREDSAGEDLSALLVRALADAGRNQSWLAKETGIPLATINAWVKRTRGNDGGIDPDRLRLIADVLPTVTVAEVFASVGRRTPGPLDAEREAKLLRLYRSLPTSQQRILVEQAEMLAKVSRAS